MFKIITKKEYDTYNQIINEQSEQIKTLIELARDANARTTRVTKAYCDLLDLIDDKVVDLPPEVRALISEINRNLLEAEP